MSNWKDTKCGKCKIQRSSPVCNGCEKFNRFVPMTNYDRIHNMSMEEMAEFLPEVTDLFCKPTDKCMVFDINHCGECEEIKECALKWLQAESDKT